MKFDYYLKRFAAAFIDVILIAVIMFIYTRIVSGDFSMEEKQVPTKVFVPVFYLYFIIQESVFNTTIGKRIFSLKVVSKKGINPFKIIIRNILNLIEIIIPIIYPLSVLITGFTGKKVPRKIGDLMSGCSVIQS